jgi:predicted component of type VI protein secretion system
MVLRSRPPPAPKVPPPQVERRAPIRGGGDLDFAAMFEAAGIDPARMTPELSRQFGMILRVVAEGLMKVLRARDKIKDEFRMRMTSLPSEVESHQHREPGSE